MDILWNVFLFFSGVVAVAGLIGVIDQQFDVFNKLFDYLSEKYNQSIKVKSEDKL